MVIDRLRARPASRGIITPYFAGRGLPLRAFWWDRARSCCLRFQEMRQAVTCFPPRYRRSGLPVLCAAWSSTVMKSLILGRS